MAVFLSHSTSRKFWRCKYPESRVPLPARALQKPYGEAACSMDEVLECAPSWALGFHEEYGNPIEAIAFGRPSSPRSRHHLAHTWSGRIPARSFYSYSENVNVTSVEFEFLLLASQVDIRQLILYGDEICGLYSFDPEAERGFRKRTKPITTKARLAKYLSGAKGCRGCKAAMRALKYVEELSASPMESVVEMLLCLPRMLGGYGLPRPEMNIEVPLSPRAQRIAQRSKCIADLCYPLIKLDIEYQGEFDHDNEKGFVSDRARVTGLLEMGYEVIELTYDQVAHLERFELIARYVAKKLGVYLKPQARGATPERIKLRQLAFAWNRNYGEPEQPANTQRAPVHRQPEQPASTQRAPTHR